MAQVTTASTTVHDVVVVGSGAGGGTVTKVLADLGVSVLLMEAGPMLNMADLKEHMWPYNVPHRGAGPKGEAYSGRPTGFTYSATYGGAQLAGEPVHRRARERLLLVPLADPRRPHESLRSHHAALRRLRLQATLARRPRLRLADQLRRSRAVLRQGGDLHRRDRHRREDSQRARRDLSRPRRRFASHDTLVQRSCAKLDIRAVARAPGRHHVAEKRPSRRATTAASAAAAA